MRSTRAAPPLALSGPGRPAGLAQVVAYLAGWHQNMSAALAAARKQRRRRWWRRNETDGAGGAGGATRPRKPRPRADVRTGVFSPACYTHDNYTHAQPLIAGCMPALPSSRGAHSTLQARAPPSQVNLKRDFLKLIALCAEEAGWGWQVLVQGRLCGVARPRGGSDCPARQLRGALQPQLLESAPATAPAGCWRGERGTRSG